MLKNAAIVSLLFLAAAAAGPRAEEVTVTTPVAESAWIGVIVAEAPGSGVRVVVTVDDGPGQLAGLRVGDVIVRVSGRPVRNAEDFRAVLRSRTPGEQVPLLVRRNGAEREYAVLAEGRPLPERSYLVAQARPTPEPPAQDEQGSG